MQVTGGWTAVRNVCRIPSFEDMLAVLCVAATVHALFHPGMAALGAIMIIGAVVKTAAPNQAQIPPWAMVGGSALVVFACLISLGKSNYGLMATSLMTLMAVLPVVAYYEAKKYLQPRYQPTHSVTLDPALMVATAIGVIATGAVNFVNILSGYPTNLALGIEVLAVSGLSAILYWQIVVAMRGSQMQSMVELVGKIERRRIRDVSDLARSAAHELVGPVHAAERCCQVFAKDRGNDDRYIERLSRSVGRIAEVRQFLRSYVRSIDVHQEGADLRECHEIACSIMQFRSRKNFKKLADITEHIPHGLRAKVAGPELVQILVSIYSRDGQDLLESGPCRFDVNAVRGSDGRVVLTVADSTPGQTSHHWEDFVFRLTSLMKTNEGSIEVDSGVGGRKFKLILPLID